MFSSILDKLDGWFGKSFVVASLLPVLLFGGANILMARFVFPQTSQDALAYFAKWPFAPLDFTASFLIVCAIVAYLTEPWVRFTLNGLRGDNWPKGLAALGVADESAKLRALDETKRERGELKAGLNKFKGDEPEVKLIDARQQGVAVGAISQPAKIEAAKLAAEAIARLRDRGEIIDVRTLEQAVDVVAKALERNCADKDALVVVEPRSYVEVGQCEELNGLYRSLLAAIDYAMKRADFEWTAAVNRRNSRMPRGNVAPTELGNKYAALNDYLYEIFTIDIDFFLPIIRMILIKDKDVSELLESAQRRLDFAARTLVLVIVFTITWLIAVACAPKSIIAVAVVGSAGAVVAVLGVEIIKTSFDRYSEAIRAICILKRFEVLTALHMKLPANWSAERSLWKSVNEQLQWGSAAPSEIEYEHTPK